MKIFSLKYFFKKQGFSLVEVLIVVALISILSSIAFIIVKDSKRTAGRTVCLANTKSCFHQCVAEFVKRNVDINDCGCNNTVYITFHTDVKSGVVNVIGECKGDYIGNCQYSKNNQSCT